MSEPSSSTLMSKTLTASSLAKQLASCNQTTREKSLRLLKTWLPSQTELSTDEMKKIWKGLFYCVWHADKQQFQLDLINHLASLLVSLDLSISLQYFDAFLLTMRREWSGIDFLRLDKFYLLIRRFVCNLFELFKKSGWDLELVGRFMCMLEERTLLSEDSFPSHGVNYHLCEVFMEELKGFLPVKVEVAEVLVKLFVKALGKSLDKVLLGKIRSRVFGCLLENGGKLLERKKEGGGGQGKDGNVDDVELVGSIALMLGFSNKFFELGSSEDCVQGNRKVLFGLHEEFGKLEKDLASLKIEISMPNVRNEDDDDEVPELVPISHVEIANASVDKKSKKKNKKAKTESGQEVVNVSIDKLSKKMKKDKKASGESESKSKKTKKIKNDKKESSESESGSKKSKKKKRDLSENSVVLEGENGIMSTGENLTTDGGPIEFNDSVISNLQMKFEKVAAEVGMGMDREFSLDSPELPVIRSVQKKRKRAKCIDGQVSLGDGGSTVGRSGEKSAKKVRFSMKNNLVWKPHSPLPPQSVRVPPSATPRGSALKKGVPAGPVIETPTKKVKRMISPLKKARKGLKSVSPSVKRLKKLRTYSA